MNMAASRSGRGALWVAFWILVVFLYAPIVVLGIFSFNDRDIVSFPWQGFTTRWYTELFSNQQLLDALKTSAWIALLASVITTVLAIPASIVLQRRRFFGKGMVSGMMLAPLVVPLVVLGTAMLILFNYVKIIVLEPLGIPFEFGSITLIIAHVIIALPFAILTLTPRLERIPEAIEEASRDLGAGGWKTFWAITFPLLMPAVVSAFLIVYVISFDEIVLASFLAGTTTTFPLYVYSQLRLPRQLPQIPAVAVLVLLASTVLVVSAEVLRARSDRILGEGQLRVDEDDTEAVPVMAPGHGGVK
jgi:spermidine/putrescine transport system permease protein